MIVAIHAYDEIFGGLHGFEDFDVVEVNNEQEAYEIGYDMAYEVINSYWYQYEDMFDEDVTNEGIEEDTDEYESYKEEWIEDIATCEIREITDIDVTKEDILDLWDELRDIGWKEFTDKYCKEE